MYILIVEDDPFLSYDLREALLILHPDVREADSVRAALPILALGLPYFAVLDYNLKTGTSVAIAERLARENVPFCFVTADGDGVRDHPALADCPIVNKPYRIEDVTRIAAPYVKA
jgi:DNA-binding response OmpR family regulator